MSYYLVDFENVKKDGLDGIHKLGKEDKVCIFYKKTLDYLKKALIYGRTSRISS